MLEKIFRIYFQYKDYDFCTMSTDSCLQISYEY